MKTLLSFLTLILIVACGSNDEQCSKQTQGGGQISTGCKDYNKKTEIKDKEKPITYPLEVENRYELPYCRAEGYGKTVLAKDTGINYSCNNDIWAEVEVGEQQ